MDVYGRPPYRRGGICPEGGGEGGLYEALVSKIRRWVCNLGSAYLLVVGGSSVAAAAVGTLMGSLFLCSSGSRHLHTSAM